MALQIKEQELDGITILGISGRVTLGEASHQLRTKLKDLLAAGKSKVVLDLADVGYIDSAGLGTLVAGYTSARNGGATLKLANLTKKIKDQMHITKLVTVFETYDSVDEAIKSFGAA